MKNNSKRAFQEFTVLLILILCSLASIGQAQVTRSGKTKPDTTGRKPAVKKPQQPPRTTETVKVPRLTGAPTYTTTTTDTTMSSSAGNYAGLFSGSGQYNTWNIGFNAGVTSPVIALGGSNDYTNWKGALGYGFSLRKQLAHSFGLQLDFRGGKVAGNNNDAPDGTRDGVRDFSTGFWNATISGVVNVATIDYLRRRNAINFFLTAGAGLIWYNPTGHFNNNSIFDYKATSGKESKELAIPIGAGVKFRMGDAWALNLGYIIDFYDTDNFDGLHRAYPTKDHASYGYGGLEFTLGSSGKPSLDWVNPIANMYDELYDVAIRQEVEALKGRVINVENAVSALKKDSDGDGVADQFDKCPNTPAATVVDGSGCPVKLINEADSKPIIKP